MSQRNTHQKQIIREIIEGKPVHMTAEEVLGKAHFSDDRIGLATVYRNLNSLCEEGVIKKVTGDGYSFFDGNPHPHDHFHCLECGTVIDIMNDYESEMDERTAALTGAEVSGHSTVYEGICKDCLNKKKEKITWN